MSAVHNLLKNKVKCVRDKVQIIELLKWEGIKKDAEEEQQHLRLHICAVKNIEIKSEGGVDTSCFRSSFGGENKGLSFHPPRVDASRDDWLLG